MVLECLLRCLAKTVVCCWLAGSTIQKSADESTFGIWRGFFPLRALMVSGIKRFIVFLVLNVGIERRDLCRTRRWFARKRLSVLEVELSMWRWNDRYV